MTIEIPPGELTKEAKDKIIADFDKKHEESIKSLKDKMEDLKKLVKKSGGKKGTPKVESKTPKSKTEKGGTPTPAKAPEVAPERVDPSLLEKLNQDLEKARKAWLTAEFKYKNEKNQISKLTSFLVGEKSKLGNTKFGKKIGIDNEKYGVVEKAKIEYDKAYKERQIAKTADRKAELHGKPEDEVKNELKKLNIEDSNKEYNEVQAERGNNIIASTPEKSNVRSMLAGKATLLGNFVSSGVKLAGKGYNKAVDMIDGGRSVTFKIPWGKDDKGERKYIESKYRIGKFVITAAIAGLTFGGPEMWIRIARSLTTAVGSGFGLNYLTKKHEATLAQFKKELEDIEAKATSGALTPSEYALAKSANESAVNKSNKRFNLACYAIMGGAVLANIGSAMAESSLQGAPANVAEHADVTQHANVGAGNNIHVENSYLAPKPGDINNFYKLPEYLDPKGSGIHTPFRMDMPNGAPQGNIDSFYHLKDYITTEGKHIQVPYRLDGAPVDTNVVPQPFVGIGSTDSTSIDTAGLKNPIFAPAHADTTNINDSIADRLKASGVPEDSAQIKTPIFNPGKGINTSDSTLADSSNAVKTPVFKPGLNTDSTRIDSAQNTVPVTTPATPGTTPVTPGVNPNAAPGAVPAAPGLHKAFETKISNTGIGTNIVELKKAINDAYPDIKLAPPSLQHIHDTPIYDLAKEWKAFDPSNAKESMNAFGNIKMDLDTGVVSVHDELTNTDTVFAGDNSAVWKGGMIDSDHNGSLNNVPGNATGEGIDIDQVPGGATAGGGVDIDQIPGGATAGSDINIDQVPGGTTEQVSNTNVLDGIPTGNSSAQEILAYMEKHPGTKVTNPETMLPYNKSDLLESIAKSNTQDAIDNLVKAGGHKINLSGQYAGKSVILGADHRMYVGGDYSSKLTEELNSQRTAVLDDTAAPRWFSSTGKVETYPEWKHLQSESMDKLSSPGHEFVNARESRLFRHINEAAQKSGISSTGKTMSQVVEELAIKRMG